MVKRAVLPVAELVIHGSRRRPACARRLSGIQRCATAAWNASEAPPTAPMALPSPLQAVLDLVNAIEPFDREADRWEDAEALISGRTWRLDYTSSATFHDNHGNPEAKPKPNPDPNRSPDSPDPGAHPSPSPSPNPNPNQGSRDTTGLLTRLRSSTCSFVSPGNPNPDPNPNPNP